MLTGRVGLAHIDENFLDDYAAHYFYGYLKRTIDIGTVLCLAPLALPLALIVAAAIRVESPGPALFRQVRAGLMGKPFTMFSSAAWLWTTRAAPSSRRARIRV